MKEAVIREKLMEICEEMTVLTDPQNDQAGADEGLYVPENSTTLEGTVDHIRIQIKYLMFDLEASRRENRYLRQMLETRPPRGRDKRE